MSIPSNFRQILVESVDLVDLIGRYVKLKKTGVNFVGLCPFHQEKSPSFSVNPVKQFYHCFGCGKSGDAVGFFIDFLGYAYVDAISNLAKECGLEVPNNKLTYQELEIQKEQKSRQSFLKAVLEEASRFYQKKLKESSLAIAYFKGRGVTGEIALQFALGFAPDDWQNLKEIFTDYPSDLLLESGLVVAKSKGGTKSGYDQFRNRVMFPIRNVMGEYIGFGGRVLGNNKPKYINSPETEVFSKGQELYGLFEARNSFRKYGYALVTEGYMDVVALAQHGFSNAVATLGTACTSAHVQKLFRYTDTIVFGFDGDSAGKKAARKALEIALSYAKDGRQVKFLFLPDEHDPDSFIREKGHKVFEETVRSSITLSQFFLQVVSENCDLVTVEGRSKIALNAVRFWQLLPEGLIKTQLLNEIARVVQITSEELRQIWLGEKQTLESMAPREIDQGRGRKGLVSLKKIQHSSGYFQVKHGGKKMPNRQDQVIKVLLMNSELWFTLDTEEQNMLFSLGGVHGKIFHWLESMLQEYGGLAWNALYEELAKYPVLLELTSQIMKKEGLPDPIGEDARVELIDMINRMKIDYLKKQATIALNESATNPQALLQYQELFKRQQELEKKLR